MSSFNYLEEANDGGVTIIYIYIVNSVYSGPSVAANSSETSTVRHN